MPPGSLIEWIGGILGDFTVVSRFAHDHDCSELWRLQTVSPDAAPTFCYLKCHRFPGKWAGEVHALRHWTTPDRLPAPHLIACRESPCAVLLSEVAGQPAYTTDLSDSAQQKLWFAAGQWLRTYHQHENDWFGAVNPDGSPQGEPNRDPVGFVRRSLDNRWQQGKEQGLFDAAELAFIRTATEQWLPALEGETPRAVHRDYSPRNWMTGPDGTLHGVIDFEHARWDVRAADLYRWWDTDFLTRPHLADYFFDGYQGAMPDSDLQAQIRVLRLLGAASGVIWATGVGDFPYVDTNRQTLRRLMQGG